MRRRDFLLGGGAIVVSVRAVLAQQPEQLRRIALLGDTPSDWAPWTIAFIGRLRELGWSEGFNIAIDYRWSEARPERLAEIVAELVKHKPDVIVTYGGAVSVLEKATASIPIVFAIAVDPLGVGLVGNLSHPGGNTTGLSLQQTESTGKRLEVLREIVPSLHRLGIMFDGGYRASVEESAQLQLMALKLGLAASPYEIRRAEDIAPAFDVLKGNADALYVAENALTATNRTTIVTLALDTKLPTICTTADFVRAGCIARTDFFPTMDNFFGSKGVLATQRIDKSWLVFASIENFEHDRCVDFFSRPDGSFGCEEVRRDPEDRGAWTPVQYYSGATYSSKEAALTAARQSVAWLPEQSN
jgi:putative ABC transport system substrate-binding protein